MQELRKNNTNIPLEVVNYPNIPLEYLTPEGERAILKGYERGLRSQSLNTQVYPSTNETLQPFKRTEILLNPVSVESARTWCMAGFYIGGGLSFVAGGAYLLALAAAAVGVNILGAKIIVIGVCSLGLIFAVSRIKTTKRVIHEHQGGERRKTTYNTYNNCKF